MLGEQVRVRLCRAVTCPAVLTVSPLGCGSWRQLKVVPWKLLLTDCLLGWFVWCGHFVLLECEVL